MSLLSRREERLAICASALSHILWGLHPVCSRYLQTKPQLPLDGINLLAVAQLTSLLLNPVVTRVVGWFTDRTKDTAVADECPPKDDKRPSSFESNNPLLVKAEQDCDGGAPEAGEAKAMAVEVAVAVGEGQGDVSRKEPRSEMGSRSEEWTRSKVGIVVLFGSLAACRAALNILSARFTKAYNVQLVAMGGPFITALISRCTISEIIPWTLFPALTFAAFGQFLFVSAQGGVIDDWWSTGTASRIDGDIAGENRPNSRLSTDDWLGMGLQFVSMFFSAGARVTMKTSAKAIRNPANLMAAQYVFCALPGLVYSSFVHVGGANGTSSSSSSSSAWAAWAALSAGG